MTKNFHQDIDKLQKIRLELVKVFENSPENLRNSLFFNQWSVRNILAHLNGWLELDISHFEALLNKKEACWAPDIEKFNVKSVEKRADESYENLLEEFRTLSEQILKLYQNLPNELWNKQFISSHNLTPAISLKEEINHWQKHLDAIKAEISKEELF